MIVQELRKIQERTGWLPDEEMRALSARLNVPLHRLHEVASFYPLYRLKPPPEVLVHVCRDMACHLAGAPALTESLKAYANELSPSKIAVHGVSCLGQCDRAVACIIENTRIHQEVVFRGASEADLRGYIQTAFSQERLGQQKASTKPLGWKIDVYNGRAEYTAVRKFVEDGCKVPAPLKQLETANLRGMGGAGFPTFKKWSAVKDAPGDPKYIVCNADESEPGTFKDRELLRRAPYLVIEGMVLAALVTGAERGYIYIRHEYHEEAHVVEHAVEDARRAGVVGANVLGTGKPFHLEVFMSPGGYVQGEESALLEAIEDRRGEPRNKPPFPVFSGLFGKPTVINNVETLSWVPFILTKGGEAYRDGGTNGEPGIRFVSISGDVVKPGVYEVPFGQTVRELIMDTAGGLHPGRKLKAIAPSGPSGGFLPAKIPVKMLPDAFVKEKVKPGEAVYDILDLPLGLNTVGKMGGMLGAAFVVYDNRRDMVEQALNCTQFYRNESCGKCVPCRTGSQKMTDLIKEVLDRRYNRNRLELIQDLGDTMGIASICGLGQVVGNPMTSVLRYFTDDLAEYVMVAVG